MSQVQYCAGISSCAWDLPLKIQKELPKYISLKVRLRNLEPALEWVVEKRYRKHTEYLQFLKDGCAKQMRLGNLEPALEWVAENKDQMAASSGDAAASLFEFKLHRLQFLDVLNTKGTLSQESVGHDSTAGRARGTSLYHNMEEQGGTARVCIEPRGTLCVQLQVDNIDFGLGSIPRTLCLIVFVRCWRKKIQVVTAQNWIWKSTYPVLERLLHSRGYRWQLWAFPSPGNVWEGGGFLKETLAPTDDRSSQ